MAKTRITIPVFIPHSGCPHSCVFCNQWRVTGIGRKQNPDDLHDIISKYMSAVPETVSRIEVAFFGGSFTAIPVEEQTGYLSAVQQYIKRGIIHSIRISTRPDYISEGILNLLKKYNVETVELGVQSFSDEVLRASGRGHNAEQVFRAFALLRGNGFRTGIQLMPGLPGDNYDRSIQSAIRTVELKPDDVRIYPAVVLKDTEMENMFREGRFNPLTVDEAVALGAVMYGMFAENGINVIRMGLHPMDLNGGGVVSGPYHEALGFMIKARYRRSILEKVMINAGIDGRSGEKILIMIPERLKEEYIGMKKGNIFYLKEKFHLSALDYKTGNIEYPSIL